MQTFKNILVILLLTGGCGFSLGAEKSQPLVLPEANLSLKNEVQAAIQRGLRWLEKNQNPDGSWSLPDFPALTAMSLMCFQGEPSAAYRGTNPPAFIQRGFDFLLKQVRPDGGIYQTNYATYNTAISMMALLGAQREAYKPTILKARRFLVGLQRDFGEIGKCDTVMDGGIGYGSHYQHSDMGNTLAALEALHFSRPLLKDTGGKEPELNYAAAIQFLQNCQNLPSHNRQDWVSDDPKDQGGFIYYPGHSMAGGVTNAATGKVSLRSYGSISYGGMLSYLYAELNPDDPRVKAVLEWLGQNYSIEENPGMGAQGLLFYYHTMAKALTVARLPQLPLADGKQAHWRQELAAKLVSRQQGDGSWANENNRWMEKDPVLATAYCLMAIEMAYQGL